MIEKMKVNSWSSLQKSQILDIEKIGYIEEITRKQVIFSWQTNMFSCSMESYDQGITY